MKHAFLIAIAFDTEYGFQVNATCDGEVDLLYYPEGYKLELAIEKCNNNIGCTMVFSPNCQEYREYRTYALCINGTSKPSNSSCAWNMDAKGKYCDPVYERRKEGLNNINQFYN